ncbi:hypothetical protein M2139_000300 [Enterococcus sp. PF1-24]|uniref:ORF6N domain-containing protein n=1 Tax=unclassified Enterococcus TaxID=2608891 RepID=UPI002476BD11|nr:MULTISPECIES: ORF6N domain-containing protein [unclassified Enterococcus]MDH6363280.1 hypothetical protein [Enterococcus sp. PFB1-1]MDH6400419.1 hypothetical protein [Enterococcus sp. PF1-24]
MELKVTGKQKVGKLEFTGIEGGFGNGKRAMLVKEIAGVHGKEVKHINELINRNRKRFKDGVDILDLKVIVQGDNNSAVVRNDSKLGGSEPLTFETFGFSQNQINAANNIYILSERGYSKLLKILEDDLAWELYDQLVDGYFNMRQSVKLGTSEYLNQERLEIMKQNAATKHGELIYKIAMEIEDEEEKQRYLKSALHLVLDEEPPVFNATEIGERLGVSKNKVGRLANKLGLKSDYEKNEFSNIYGCWKQQDVNGAPRWQWFYFEAAVAELGKGLEK